MTMAQIKPCPFCGSENVKYRSLAGRVFCKDCQARGPCGATDKDAIKKWNAAPRTTAMIWSKNLAPYPFWMEDGNETD